MKTAQEVLESKLPKNRDVFPYCEVLEAMREFATLHAQKIADKMVEERLRDAFDAGMDYDRMIHGNCIDGVDFETWYNRLKSRESHDSKS